MLRHRFFSAFLPLAASAALAAQAPPIPDAACPEQRVEADLGLEGIECEGCHIRSRRSPGEPSITFTRPPAVHGVRLDGPAAGRLQAGDLILTVDGHAITSREGARAFAGLRPGVPVHLTVRRGSRRLDVQVVPTARCAERTGDRRTHGRSGR